MSWLLLAGMLVLCKCGLDVMLNAWGCSPR